MQHQVRLAQLPTGVQFPAHLGERIAYDAERHELSFRGFMTKYTYDELAQLSKDVPYHEALEQLFVLSSEEVVRPQAARGISPVILAAAAAGVVALGLLVWAVLFRHPAQPPARPCVVHAVGR